MTSSREIMPSKCRAAFSTLKLRALTLTMSSRTDEVKCYHSNPNIESAKRKEEPPLLF